MVKKSGRLSKTNLLTVASVIIVAVILFLVFRQPNDKERSQIPSTTPKQQAAASSQKQQGAAATSDSQTATATDKTSSGAGSTTTGGLLAPSGTFVSNHNPNLSGSPSPQSEQSVCNTTPGASCLIKFTKGNVVKTLANEQTDSNGSAFWDWDIRDAGFTTGQWQIIAVATLNGQTKSTSDSLALNIQP